MRIAGFATSASLLLFVTACASTPKDAPALNDETTPGNDGSASTAGHTGQGPDASDAPSAASSQDGPLSAAAQDLTLRQQYQAHQLQEALSIARSRMENGRLEEALTAAEQALRLDRDNLEAQRLHSTISGLMGNGPGETVTIQELINSEWQIRIEQIKSDAMDGLAKGKNLLMRGEYADAIQELVLTRTLVRTVPYKIDWEGADTEVDALLARAREDQASASAAQLQSAQRQAHEQLQNREKVESKRREAITASMISQAIDSFDRGQYDAAMEYADRALRRDPRNDQAANIRQSSFRAGREKVRDDYIEAKREEFAKWREHLDELLVPWTNVLTLPDPDHWRRISTLRTERGSVGSHSSLSASELTLRAQLQDTMVRLPGIEDEESLRVVIDRIAAYTGLPLVVDPAAENLVFDEGIVFNFNLEAEISVQQALNLISKQGGEGVTWTVRHDAVLVTSTEKARGKPEIENHDVQDLIMGLTDFTGPRIDRLRLLDELEDDDGGGPFGGILESPRLIEIDDLATLIQENVAVGTWEDDGVAIEPGEGYILITHSPDVQQRVRDFLDDLRRFNSSLVTIESKFMTIGDNWIQQIGIDWRGLDNADVTDVTNGLEDMASRGLDNGGSGSSGEGAAGPPSAGFFFDDGGDGDFRGTAQNFFSNPLGEAITAIGGLTFQLTFLDDAQVSLVMRAVEKQTQFEVVNSQILSVHNTQRAYVTVINQQAYIQDFDVEVAQFQAVADPQINVLHEGVVLDVRPTIHHSRKYLTLEIQPTVAKIVSLRTFSTTLGGNTSSVDFQLPELEVQSINTSAIIPDGGSILLGGLSSMRNIERRAEVPWLARIPLLGLLFKQEGYSDERKSLMILIRASIYDIRQSVQEKLERRY
jgi:tetratricopeptide (TPR) repeat protein